MALSRCECGQVFDIPGVYRTYRQPDGRCAKCNGVSGEPKMDLPKEVVNTFKATNSVAINVEQRVPYTTDGPKVEAGIPIPAKSYKTKKKHPRKGVSKYPFAQMRPPRDNGDMDSFFVKNEPGRNDIQNNSRIAGAIYGYRKKHPKFTGEFKYRKVVENGVPGIRIWRIK